MPERERPSAANTGAKKRLAANSGSDSTLNVPMFAAIPVQMKSWVTERLNACRGEAVIFGSDEWFCLPVDDPRRDAAAARAALAWYVDGLPSVIAANFHNEIMGRSLAAKRREDEDWAEAKRAHRQAWPARRPGRYGVSNAEFLARRQAQLATEAGEGR